MHSASQGALKRALTIVTRRLIRCSLGVRPYASLYLEVPKGDTSAGPQQVRQLGDVSRTAYSYLSSGSQRRAEADNRYSRIADKSHRYSKRSSPTCIQAPSVLMAGASSTAKRIASAAVENRR